MKEDTSVENKRVSWKKFRFDLLDEDSQDLMEEVIEGIRDKTMTAVINKICMIARTKIRKPEAEHVLLPPNCGWCMYDPEEGDICLYGLKKPIRSKLLKWRKLKNFRCDLCEILDMKREEQLQLSKVKQKQMLKASLKNKSAAFNINYGQGYKVSRDLVLFVMRYKTLEPTELSKRIFEVKAKDITPESITMWFKRHSDIHKLLKEQLEKNPDVTPKEIRELLKKRREYQPPLAHEEDYAR